MLLVGKNVICIPRQLGITQASVWIQPLRRSEMTEHMRRDDLFEHLH